jgi:arylsulfatase A-like enzyme
MITSSVRSALLLGLLCATGIAWADPGPASEPSAESPPAAAAKLAAAAPGPVSAVTRRPDVIFVTIDTLRRDHLSCYGHERLTSPTIDALARDGVLFTDCQAVIPVTGPSHASMFSGLYAHTNGAFRNGVKISEEPVLLGTLLGEHGYRSHATVAGWTLKDAQCGLARGFDTYDEDLGERVRVVTKMRRAEDVTASALKWVDDEIAPQGADRAPVFLFVHYFDPHEPYDAPLEKTPGPNPRADGGPGLERHAKYLEAYDREIAYTDAQVGVLFDGLRERGLLDEAIVVFTADHGQSFGEHDYGGKEGGHGRRVYQSTMAAPLVISAPGLVRPGRTIDLPVSHLDLFPTLASLAGLPYRSLPANLQGEDLSGLLRDPVAEPPWGGARRLRYGIAFRGAVGNKANIFRFFQNRDIEDASPVQYSIIDGAQKVIVNPKKPERYEVYDLLADPGELDPLEGQARARFATHVGKLEAWYERTKGELDTTPLTEEQIEALRSLGYVGN